MAFTYTLRAGNEGSASSSLPTRVIETVPAGSGLYNAAAITGTKSATDSGCAPVSVPDLQVAIVSSTSTPAPGAPIAYDVSASNVGGAGSFDPTTAVVTLPSGVGPNCDATPVTVRVLPTTRAREIPVPGLPALAVLALRLAVLGARRASRPAR